MFGVRKQIRDYALKFTTFAKSDLSGRTSRNVGKYRTVSKTPDYLFELYSFEFNPESVMLPI